MSIAILGAGNMAKGLAALFAKAGYKVVVGARDFAVARQGAGVALSLTAGGAPRCMPAARRSATCRHAATTCSTSPRPGPGAHGRASVPR